MTDPEEPVPVYRVHCPKHGKVRAYSWIRHGKTKDSLYLKCRICRKVEEWRNYHELPGYKERRLKAAAAWKKAHPRRVKRSRREYNALHREDNLIYAKLYRQANRERINAAKREAYRLARMLSVSGGAAVVHDASGDAVSHG